MKFQVHYKNLNPSEYLEAYAHQKLENAISKYCFKDKIGRLDFEIDRVDHQVKFRINDDLGHPVVAKVIGDDMYHCIDKLALKVDRALRKNKERMNSHRYNRNSAAFSDGFDLYEESDSLRNGLYSDLLLHG